MELKGRIDGIRKKVEVREKDVLAALSHEQKKAHDALTKPIDDLKKQKRPFTTALMMTDGDAKAVTKVLYQEEPQCPAPSNPTAGCTASSWASATPAGAG